MGWLLYLGLKEGQVECATLCVKSEVILTYTVKLDQMLTCIFFPSIAGYEGQTCGHF